MTTSKQKLSKLTSLISSGSTPLGGDKNYLDEGPVLFIRSQNVLMNKLDLSDAVYVSEDIHCKMKRTHVSYGDVLLNITGASIGRVAPFSLRNVQANVNQHVCIIRPDRDLLDSSYLSYLISSPAFQAEINRIQRGGTRQALTFGQIAEFEIPISSITHQRQTVNLLDKIRSLLELRQQAIEKLEQLGFAIFEELLQRNQAATRIRALGDVAQEGRGTFVNGPFGSDLLTSELVETGVPVIYIRDIRSGNYHRVSKAFVTQDKADQLKVCSVHPGDVLVAKVGDPPGVAAVYPSAEPKAIVTQDVIRIRVDKNKATPEYVACFLMSAIGKSRIKGITVEATRARFSLQDFKKLDIELPPISEQLQFTQSINRISFLRSKCLNQLSRLSQLYAAVVHSAFTPEPETTALSVR